MCTHPHVLSSAIESFEGSCYQRYTRIKEIVKGIVDCFPCHSIVVLDLCGCFKHKSSLSTYVTQQHSRQVLKVHSILVTLYPPTEVQADMHRLHVPFGYCNYTYTCATINITVCTHSCLLTSADEILEGSLSQRYQN